MTFFNVYLPANAHMFYKLIIEMAEFDFINIDPVVDFLFPFLASSEPEGKQIDSDKETDLSGSLLRLLDSEVVDETSKEDTNEEQSELDVEQKMGKIFLVILAALVSIPIYFTITIFKARNKLIKMVYFKLNSFIFYNGLIRYFYESYIQVGITVMSWLTVTHEWGSYSDVL